MQTRYKMQTENLYCLFVWYVIICHLTTYRVSRNRFSATIFYDYLHYVEYSQPVSWSQTFLFQAWCLYRIHQLDKRGCRCKWGVTIEYLTRAIFEKQLTALHVVHKFHLFNRYVFTLLQKMRTGTKTVPSTWYIFNVQGYSQTDFHICALYCYSLTWGTGEFL